ncbi:hypothetical protein DLAC_03434 [Tieghemostelium lacteum]|uniref:Calponin-homology (CH) domain-containing protein n=1 Tax=Tieghemostelium lacteum TaxID=361077 RepID=A0A152A2H4_TIELA|nr:hypothetical protein DLAC_03434 [Tieghemostelium lacteum]|eukprot:KYR00271.1 hypothetical protein DLAC_03434 [Tieghemostelium lacteum]
MDIYQNKEKAVKKWIEYLLEIDNLNDNNIYELLRDGRMLCKIMNKFHSRIDYIHYSDSGNLPKFKQIENINLFIKKCRLYLPEEQIFHTNDLLDPQNLEIVFDTLIYLSNYFEKNGIVEQQPDMDMSSSSISSFSSNSSEDNLNDRTRQQQQQQLQLPLQPQQQSTNVFIDNSSIEEEEEEEEVEDIDEEYDSDYDLQDDIMENEEDSFQNLFSLDSSLSKSNSKSQSNINTNSRNRVAPFKKGINGYILDGIIEIKYSILVPFFISLATGFGIKFGRSCFVQVCKYTKWLEQNHHSIFNFSNSQLMMQSYYNSLKLFLNTSIERLFQSSSFLK